MWIWEVEYAITEIKKHINEYTVTIKDIHPAYDGIIFELSNGENWKYWYKTRTATKLGNWRER